MGSRVHPDGSEEDMFSTIDPSGAATGRAAVIVAETRRLEQKVLICALAQNSAACLNK